MRAVAAFVLLLGSTACQATAQEIPPTALSRAVMEAILDFRVDVQADSLRLASCVGFPEFKSIVPTRYRSLLLEIDSSDCEREARSTSQIPIVTEWSMTLHSDSSASARLAGRDTVVEVRVRTVVDELAIVERYFVAHPMVDPRHAWKVTRYEVVSESRAH